MSKAPRYTFEEEQGDTLAEVGLPFGIYTTSNVTTDRTFDADNTTISEIADIVGTLLSDMGAA